MAASEEFLTHIRYGTAAQLTADAPILKKGELAYTTDNFTLRVGDGVTAFASLRRIVAVV